MNMLVCMNGNLCAWRAVNEVTCCIHLKKKTKQPPIKWYQPGSNTIDQKIDLLLCACGTLGRGDNINTLLTALVVAPQGCDPLLMIFLPSGVTQTPAAQLRNWRTHNPFSLLHTSNVSDQNMQRTLDYSCMLAYMNSNYMLDLASWSPYSPCPVKTTYLQIRYWIFLTKT